MYSQRFSKVGHSPPRRLLIYAQEVAIWRCLHLLAPRSSWVLVMLTEAWLRVLVFSTSSHECQPCDSRRFDQLRPRYYRRRDRVWPQSTNAAQDQYAPEVAIWMASWASFLPSYLPMYTWLICMIYDHVERLPRTASDPPSQTT